MLAPSSENKYEDGLKKNYEGSWCLFEYLFKFVEKCMKKVRRKHICCHGIYTHVGKETEEEGREGRGYYTETTRDLRSSRESLRNGLLPQRAQRKRR